MRRKRTIYFNDARHYYLFVFEPPMKLEDAWRPIDEVAGTPVDTFVYGVARGDGLYYPSKVGTQFKYGEHDQFKEFRQAAYWRTWHNMQSLMDQGLDPLKVLIDRAHDKGMDFFASLRLTFHEKMDEAWRVNHGGQGWVHEEVRDHQFAVLEELATQYETEGVELDYPGNGACFRAEDVEEYTPVMTEWVGKVAKMVRNRAGGPGQVGARVYPTEAINKAMGLDVRAWLQKGLVDYVTPMVYSHNLTDSNLDFEWLVEAAHTADASVYPIVQPDYYLEEERRHRTREHASPAMMRAAAANYWARGADGMYTWFLRWPLGTTEHRILSELGDADLSRKGDKHYFINRRTPGAENAGYETLLPLKIAAADTGVRHAFPFYISDDIEGTADRIRQVRLKIQMYDLVTADKIEFLLNGQSLESQTCLRQYGEHFTPYNGMWLDFELREIRPRRGHNLLEITLLQRAEGLKSALVIEDVEIIVEYGSYPSGLR
jgi:hypothetical protein